MISRFLVAALALVSVVGCSSSSKSEADCDACCADDGFVSLFDGETLAGWRNWGSQDISGGWAVRDGALTRVAEGAGNIITEKQYSSFDLRFEWKVASGANSGVFYTVVEGDEFGLITGPEYQVLDNANHPDGKNPKTSAGSNYALHAPTKDMTKPVGEWNEARIVMKGDHVEHWLNGEKVVDYTLGSEDWTQRVAASKFSKWPAYGARRSGHIGLQDHGDAVAYRNIRIKDLSKP